MPVTEIRDLKESFDGFAATTIGAAPANCTSSQLELLGHRLKSQGASAAAQNTYPISPLCNPLINSSANCSSSYNSAIAASALEAKVSKGLKTWHIVKHAFVSRVLQPVADCRVGRRRSY